VFGGAWALDRLQRSSAEGRKDAGDGGIAIAGVVLVCVAAGALGARTIARNRDYATELKLSQTTLEHWPSAVAHDMVGLSLARLDRREEAIAELRQAVDDYAPARYDLGVQLYSLDRFDEAIAEFRRFVALEPHLFTTSAAYTLLGGSLDRTGRQAEAIDAYQRALSGPIPDLQAHGFLADLLLDAQRYDEAVAHYRAYLAAFPGRTAALSNMGIALASSHKTDEALAVLRNAVEADPSNGQARVNLAQVLLDVGQIQAAEKEARQVVALTPRNPLGYDLLGQALAMQKNWPEARRAFEQALQIAPNYTPARENLRRLPK
jgi:tetratricopeptide (TPR) repeat protein